MSCRHKKGNSLGYAYVTMANSRSLLKVCHCDLFFWGGRGRSRDEEEYVRMGGGLRGWFFFGGGLGNPVH